jgi:cysteinyl-tRNA synthetase
LNTPGAITGLHALADAAFAGDAAAASKLLAAGKIVGLLNVTPAEWFHGDENVAAIEKLIAERSAARAAKDFARADKIRKKLEDARILLEDSPTGTTWRKL